MNSFAQFIIDGSKNRTKFSTITDENKSVAWDEFLDMMYKVAAYAAEKKLSGVIPVLMERRIETAAAILGLNFAGVGVAPLSFTAPAERINNICEQAGNKAFNTDDFNAAMSAEQISNYKYEKRADTAYVIFTSGSTGKPKGVMLSNDNMIKSIIRTAGEQVFDFTSEDVVMQLASFEFIALVLDLFAPLYMGCDINIVSENMRKDPAYITEYINKKNITAFFAPPQLLKKIGEAPTLRCVLTGSDRVTDIGPKGYTLVNIYGMSEVAAMATSYKITGPMEVTPIGKLSDDFTGYILDENGELADEGELCLSGAVSDGYLNMPEQTNAAFVKNPFSNEPGLEVLLHTGDIVKRLDDGNLVYLNRKDFMIKINGCRVEPGEAESVLMKTEGIKNAVVKGFSEDNGRSYLVAYCVSDKEINAAEIKNKLAYYLPSYMIPSFYVKMDAIPLNANGKIDRKALLPPDNAEMQEDYEAASSLKEQKLCRAFEKTLKLERVGVNDDFFALGGDSISAVEVIDYAGIEGLIVSDVFSGRTPKKIALSECAENNVYKNLSVGISRAPLTSSQMGIYLECVANPESTMYNIPILLSFKRDVGLTCEAVKKAVDGAISLHPALYSRIAADGDNITMLRMPMPEGGICKAYESETNDIDISPKPFDLSSSPLIRATAALTEDTVYVFADMHHIISDGSSVSVLIRDICKLIAGIQPDEETVDSFCLSEIESRINDSIAYTSAKEYFNGLLSGEETDSALLPDAKDKTEEAYERAEYNIDVNGAANYLRGSGLTESTFYMGAFGYALSKMTGLNNVIFNSGENGRKSGLLANTVSMLVRTLPVVMHIDENKSSSEMLSVLQEQFFTSMENDCCSFAELAREYGLRSDVTFVYQGEMLSDFEAQFGKVSVSFLKTNAALANISFYVFKTATGCRLFVDYKSNLYKRETIDRFIYIFREALTAFISDLPLSKINLISEEDEALLNGFNDNGLEYNHEETVIDLFRMAAKAFPNNTAVVYNDKKYSYSEADVITEKIGAYIQSKGIGKNDAVSVLIPRCEYMVLASIGIMKAGAMYQPLDPSYPEERLSFMCKDASSRLLIADRELYEKMNIFEGDVLFTDEIDSLSEGKCTLCPSVDDGYILLYTSGSTGLPKGCKLLHKNIAEFTTFYVKRVELTSESHSAVYASYGFDAHMLDIFPILTKGGEVHIVPEEIRLDFPAIKEYFERNAITHSTFTTQIARQFVMQYGEIKHLKYLVTGGEKLVSLNPPKNYRLINGYGPTECTMFVTSFELDGLYDDIPIGKANLNVHTFVCDSFGRRVPIGVPGELIIAGPQVAEGYINREEKTKEVFVRNPFETSADFVNCYKTGDIVRYLEDGNIQFIGRRDMQVKIRGFRIELSEVENAISDYPGITDAVVTAIDNNGVKHLCAYIVSENEIDIDALKQFIGESHPSYMIPTYIIKLESLPLTVNGKIDKKKLPVPELHCEDETKPENEIQRKLFNMAAEAIGSDAFGIRTDLFSAGLSSIGSIRLCSLLAEEFSVNVKIRDLKRYETVEKLERFIRADLEKDSSSEMGTKAEKQDVFGRAYPITKTMEGIFAECISRPESTVYNIPLLLKLGKGIDEGRLKKAIVSAVNAHSYILTEIFTDENGTVCQHGRIDGDYTEAEIIDVNNISENELEKLIKPFKLTDSRLFEISVIHCDSLFLLINIHHIIADGTSLAIFISDVEKAYNGEAISKEKFSGFDVAADEHEMRTAEELKLEKEYYSELLEDVDKDFLPLPDRYSYSEKSSGKLILPQNRVSFDEVKNFCKNNKVSLNAFFIGVFGFVLAKYSASDYSVFNTIYNGRNDSRMGNTVAMLVKTLPIVCRIDKETVKEYLSEIADQLMETMANDLFSYAEISNSFGVKNDVMFIYQGDTFEIDNFCGDNAEEIALGLSESKTAMALQVNIKAGKIVYNFEYASDKFTDKLARSFVSAFDCAVSSFIRSDSLKAVSLLSNETEAEIEAYNNTEFDYDKSLTITDMFLKNAEQQPEHICVAYKDVKLTYAEVEELSGKLALFLMKKGIGRGNVVSILIKRDENMVICAHGAVRTGAAYLGLDPTYPAERIEFMIKDSGSAYIIADRSLAHIISGVDVDIIYTDEISALPAASKKALEEYAATEKNAITPENDALIVYSSGTTGLPKGSVLQHKNIVCFFRNYEREALLSSNSNIATYASFGFDGGAQDVFGALMAGAALYIIPDEIRLDITAIERFYTENNITNGFMTTQVGCMFIGMTKCKSLKCFMVGGEKFIPVKGPEHIIFKNGYGPSESMCYVNMFDVRNADSLQPIGSVNGNTKEYIIDKFGNRLPFGACGEMCISGGQLGRGYLNRAEKTAEVFVKNPFCDKAEYSRMYKTGDIVRLLPDGNYDFVGRRDGQVKIRGFRIELSEIEQQIRKFNGINNAVVTAFDNPAGGKALAAYITSEKQIDADELKSFIGSEKPDYMIPPVIMQLDDIPLTSNGKVDFRKLPKPELSFTRNGIEPSNEKESTICGIFGDVLGIDKVYADDDFFKIGGTSISAIQVIVKCEQKGYPVVYKNLFANPTPQKLAALVSGNDEKNDINATDLDKGVGYDYSALKYNVISNLPKIKNIGVGDVLLTGVTGFLGSHIYRELINSTDGKVICIVRSKENMTALTRFEMTMVYYFEDWYGEKAAERTVIIDGELENEETAQKLEAYHFDTIINCAANVKHFAVEEEMLTSNVSGVENLIRLAEKKNARLIQISSLSVCGESVNGSVPKDFVFKETDLNIGQSLENKYIYTKYLAERAVIDSVSRKKIKGKVIRLGNLMPRAEDSEFQINAASNGFMRFYVGFQRLKCFPINMLDASVEFSPIDFTAKAVLLLSGTPDEFTMFHAKNCNAIQYGYMLYAMRNEGIGIEVVEDNEFERRLKLALEKENDVTALGGLLAYRNQVSGSLADLAENTSAMDKKKIIETRIKIASDNTFTTKALYRLGFVWPLISEEYLNKTVKALIDLDFF